MRECTRYALTIALVLALMASAAAGSTVPTNPYVSWITSDMPGVEFTNRLTATVTQNQDGSYHFQYVLEFQQDPFGLGLSDFSIGNLDYLPFSNPYCSHPRSYDPFDGSGESLYWWTSPVPTGTNVTFSFDSIYSYTITNCTVGAGGFPSGGSTLGMKIPEPASATALLMGLGMFWATLKRKRR